jgi:molybdopterin-guanine dinucleotide biosynthesis protein A
VDISAIILTGPSSSRSEFDIGILELNNKPLIKHVVDLVKTLAEEIIIVTDSQERADVYIKIVGSDVQLVVDAETAQSPLLGALAGFQKAKGKFSLLISFDAPFVSQEIAKLLIELCPGRSAVICRWSNAQIEPFPSVYRTPIALEAASTAIENNKKELSDIVEDLQGVRYVSTLVIQELDSELKTFFRVRTPIDIKKAQILTKPKPKKTRAQNK